MTMKNKNLLSASIISGRPLDLNSDLDELSKSQIDLIHFDVMDGVFVPRYGLFPEYLEDIKRKINVLVEVHLMAVDPEKYLNEFVDSGADIITPHIESTNHIHRVINKIRSFKALPGVALNISTPISSLEFILEDLHLVTIMAINPGIKGHSVIEKVYSKIEQLRKTIDKKGLDTLIQVDGGVNFNTASKMNSAGADILVCGTGTIFNQNESLSRKIKELRNLING